MKVSGLYAHAVVIVRPLLLAGAMLGGAMFSAAAAPPLDVVGFHPGMTLSEVKAKLEAVTPPLEVKVTGMTMPELGPTPAPWLITGKTVEKSGKPITIERFTATVTMPPNSAILWGLSHSLHFLDDEQPAVADVVKALRDKYGKEALAFGLKQFYWGWDEKGVLMADKQMRQCAAFVGIDRMMNTQTTVNRGDPVPPAQAACPNGKYIMAAIIPGRNPAVATDMQVDFVDSAIDTAAMAATREARLQARNKAAVDQVEKAKQNKPKL